jgi:hypothetical protein
VSRGDIHNFFHSKSIEITKLHGIIFILPKFSWKSSKLYEHYTSKYFVTLISSQRFLQREKYNLFVDRSKKWVQLIKHVQNGGGFCNKIQYIGGDFHQKG